MSRKRAAHSSLVLTVGVVLVAFTMRPPIAGVAPILPDLQRQLGLSATGASFLAAIPLLSFGALASAAGPLRRSFGEERVMFLMLGSLVTGLVLRGLLPRVLLFPATLLTCASIAVMNVLATSMIKRRFPDRVGPMLGAYSFSVMLGAAVAAGSTAPVYGALGRSSNVGLGLWVIPALVALVAWAPQAGWPHVPETPGARPRARLLVSSSIAWMVTAFWGLQCLVVYATLSWLPTFFRDRGIGPVEAGLLVSVMTVAGIPVALVSLRVARGHRGHRGLAIWIVGLSVLGLLGAGLAPVGTVWLWVVLLGIGQGGTLPLGLLFIVERAADPITSASLAAMAMGFGYLFAALGVFLVGMLHSVTGNWGASGALVLAALLLELAAGFGAARDKVVGTGLVPDPVPVGGQLPNPNSSVTGRRQRTPSRRSTR